MVEYIIDKDGKKEVKGVFKLLYTGNESEEYLQQKQFEEQQRLEQELLNNLKPSEEEVRKAEIKLVSTELLLEVGLA